ncbi:hypothetical protein SAMN05880590_102757 [Rhizobium sp. RU35A]|uniref:NAD(P)+ transhydrogenase beta chain n=1 Tax=Rhizobium sp. RU35A TaxID=1907414 RepID=UPI0009548338|nr:NAD(P)+ transhydrogenase beta chain [Rhizobium sp. RU35A]SIQ24247.1 hypothetical protein SAMN05880590_102757 [Rhizobium sp. RU35A]
MHKPGYSTSKRALWLSSIMAWLVILILSVGAAINGQSVEFGTIAVPSMVMLIAALLGIHRGFGSLDYRTAGKMLAADGASSADANTPGDAR